jgi:hypothetical protein
MALFRLLSVLFLIGGVLPCAAQSLPSHPSTSVPLAAGVAGMEGSGCNAVGNAQSQLCSQAKSGGTKLPKVFVLPPNSTCYSIREYRFAVPKHSEVPKLKSYSTCVPAARFEARNVVEPNAR